MANDLSMEEKFERALAEIPMNYMNAVFHDHELARVTAERFINYVPVDDLEEEFERALAQLSISMTYVPAQKGLIDDEDEDEEDEEEDELEEALEKVVIRGSEREMACTVCLEEFAIGSEATKMPCSHALHGECIVKWLQVQRFCPLCRFVLSADPNL